MDRRINLGMMSFGGGGGGTGAGRKEWQRGRVIGTVCYRVEWSWVEWSGVTLTLTHTDNWRIHTYKKVANAKTQLTWYALCQLGKHGLYGRLLVTCPSCLFLLATFSLSTY